MSVPEPSVSPPSRGRVGGDKMQPLAYIAGMTEQTTDEDRPEAPWSKWYRQTREDMAFRFGRRGIPVDRYREQWAMGRTPTQGARAIHETLMAGLR